MGTPARIWNYRDASGAVLTYVYRFESRNGAGKETRPLSYCRHGETGKTAWQWKALSTPRPLYALDRLAACPDATVIVVEGEKAADACQALFPAHVATTPPNGAQSPQCADWSPLAGRTVWLWPDQDAAGRGFAQAVGRLLLDAGATRVAVIEPDGFRWLPDGTERETLPEKWDAADALAEGFSIEDAARIAAGTEFLVEAAHPIEFPPVHERPCYHVLDEDAQIRGRQHMAGVYWCTSESNGDKTNPLQTWICSPLHIDALTHDAQGNNFGRLLRFKNSLGRWREWAMPMELLRADGAELRGELLAMGVGLDPYHARRMLPVYLQHTHPTRRVHCALQTGWCNGSYVLPDSVIGPDAADVIFQSGKRRHDEYTVSGTLDGWHDEIAVRAIGNPVLMLVVSTGFVGPLLARCHGESGGVHLVGDSSTGKTSAVLAACSVWGGKDYARSWRATANGMEGAAALYNDGLLALDEISECDPRDIGAIVYMLANGAGKQRAGRTGAARGVVRWRCVVLSSGERTIETSIHEGGGRIKAGQAVRMLDVPVRGRYGTWDDLHGAASGSAFSDALKRAAPLHHGHAGRAYLDRLTRDPRDFCAVLDEIRSTWPDPPGHGQEKRALARFALIGLAGELATEYGLTGWPPGAAGEAARRGYEVWRSYRASGAGRTPDEHQRILQAVADFVERHGDSRFSDFDAPHPGKTIDRCGWWRDDPAEGRRYLFTSGGMREALTGYDFARGLDALQVAGALPDSPSRGERARPLRIDGRTVKVYSIDPSALDSRSTSLIGDVTDVTGVTVSSDAGSGVTSPGDRGVTDVTGAGREGEGVTPVTSHVAPDVTENSFENSAVTPVTPKNNNVGGAQEDADEDAEYF